jgi:hypothetical protein
MHGNADTEDAERQVLGEHTQAHRTKTVQLIPSCRGAGSEFVVTRVKGALRPLAQWLEQRDHKAILGNFQTLPERSLASSAIDLSVHQPYSVQN